MLTRDLLQYSTRQGKIRPRFLDRKDQALQRLVDELVAVSETVLRRPKQEAQAAMNALALGFKRPKVGKGLVKLLTDRMVLDEPGPEPAQFRRQIFQTSMDILSAIEDGVSAIDFATKIAESVGRPVDELREQLHQDLPERRLIADFEPLDAQGLMDRYDLAQAQGLILYCPSLAIDLPAMDRPEVRRVLRFMRFCRLVVRVDRHEEGCRLVVDGPASIFEGSKGYGLQLASFLAVVPSIPEWRLEAEVSLPRRSPAQLHLSHEDPLSARFSGGAGHIPEAMRTVIDRLDIPGWTVDVAPPPLMVGATGVAVPDFALVPAEGKPIVVELFHRFHKGALHRRLEEMRDGLDDQFRVGVDKSLVKDPALSAQLEAHPQVFLFRSFPSARILRSLTLAQK